MAFSKTVVIILASLGLSQPAFTPLFTQLADLSLFSAQSADLSLGNVHSDVSPEAVADYLEGVMDTTAQAAIDSNFVGVQMTTCRITVTEGNDQSPREGIYLYQEQALSENVNEPYRQRFLQLVPAAGNNNRIESRSFKPPVPEQWTGLCDQDVRAVPATALRELVCTVSLRASSLGGFVGSTPSAGCPANVRGAVSISNVVVLHADGMDTWDRGFDAEGNQVWGAEEVPYQYRW
ncbi:MAG: chromophore lyase CpcT/CpeT [Cyanobacteria bacterium J06598_3]